MRYVMYKYKLLGNLVSADDLQPVRDVCVVVALGHRYLPLGGMQKFGEGQQLLSDLGFVPYCRI